MDVKGNTEGKYDSGKSIQALMEAAQAISAGRKEIMKSSEAIMMSCFKPGTIGEAHKSQLLDKVEEMKKLVELHNSVANRLESVARKLASGIQEEKVMSEMLAYNTFLADQLESEKINAENILTMLKNDGTGCK
jgi:ABC-type phosphate transport system ATPase subunit